MDITNFYNHNSFLNSVNEGKKIIKNTDFITPYLKRMQAIKNFKIGQVVSDNGQLIKITDIKEDVLIGMPLRWFTKSGKIKKSYQNNGGYFYNPLQVGRI